MIILPVFLFKLSEDHLGETNLNESLDAQEEA